MSQGINDFSIPAFSACARLLYEIGAFDNVDMQYCRPYINYVMSWCHYLPINTIIIGQNPYPNDIYPEIGSAFSYDESKQAFPPKTVQNLAHDLNNHDETDIDSSISCFRDSWKCIEDGVIFINESALDIFHKNKSNTRGIKEMESQIRALQIIITESFIRGQTSFTCVGMGIKATQMTSILQSWYPKDLMKMKVIRCKNPAARDIGDMPSHEVTIGNKGASKVLSSIVANFVKMSGKQRMSPVEQRKKQNKDALIKATEHVATTSDAYETELASFEDRIKGFSSDGTIQCSPEELARSLGQLRKTVNRHNNALQVHSTAFMLMYETISSSSDKSDRGSSNTIQQVPSIPVNIEARPSGGRRRVVRRVSEGVASTMQPVEETPEPSVPPTPATEPTPEPASSAPSVAPSRRRVVRRAAPVAYAQSNADTEYSIATQSVATNRASESMTQSEAINVQCFADWFRANKTDNPTYSEILYNASQEKSVTSDLTSRILDFIRQKKAEDTQYDFYDDLTNPESDSCKKAMELADTL